VTLGGGPRTADDIAAELRREFERALHERYGTEPQPDPVLATLFHTFAVQVSRIYEQAETVFPEAVIDDLISGLGMAPRLAAPAQTVVSFGQLDQRERISPETDLIGYHRTGEQIHFAPDESIELSLTDLVFAAVYEDRQLRTVAGARVPGSEMPTPPASTPLDLGRSAPALFLAFRVDASHLGGLGVFIDAQPRDGAVSLALGRSVWQLLTDDGRVAERTVLRPRRGRGGVHCLEWPEDGARRDMDGASDVRRALPLGEGPSGPQVWIFPTISPGRRLTCSAPPAIAAAAATLLPEGHEGALDRPLAWVQVPLPAGTGGVANAIQRIAVNCVTASNVEVFSERIVFDRTGTVVSMRPEGKTGRHVMGVLSVTGESGTPYAQETDVEAMPGAGQYRYRAGRLELWPHRKASGRFDAFAMVRLLYCDGATGNGIELGGVRRISSTLANVTASVANLTATAGGSAPPTYPDARVRFAELLRTRERIVTAADIEIVTLAFEPRIQGVEVSSATELTEQGLQLGETVTVSVRPSDFADPETELARLADQLARHLQDRAVIGHHIRVRVEETA
jgi:hypothetical protein